MAAYLSDLYDAILGVFAAAVPSLLQANGGGGIWRANRIMRAPLETVLNDLGTPFGVIHVATLGAADWGISNFAYEARVECYVVRQDAGDEDGMFTLLEAVRDQFEGEIAAQSMTTGQVLEVLELSWSPMLPMNERAISKQLDILAGLVAVRCVAGEIRG